eukprot:6385268-Heterocapsa_arctica.AAC.1
MTGGKRLTALPPSAPSFTVLRSAPSAPPLPRISKSGSRLSVARATRSPRPRPAPGQPCSPTRAG